MFERGVCRMFGWMARMRGCKLCSEFFIRHMFQKFVEVYDDGLESIVAVTLKDMSDSFEGRQAKPLCEPCKLVLMSAALAKQQQEARVDDETAVLEFQVNEPPVVRPVQVIPLITDAERTKERTRSFKRNIHSLVSPLDTSPFAYRMRMALSSSSNARSPITG